MLACVFLATDSELALKVWVVLAFSVKQWKVEFTRHALLDPALMSISAVADSAVSMADLLSSMFRSLGVPVPDGVSDEDLGPVSAISGDGMVVAGGSTSGRSWVARLAGPLLHV